MGRKPEVLEEEEGVRVEDDVDEWWEGWWEES